MNVLRSLLVVAAMIALAVPTMLAVETAPLPPSAGKRIALTFDDVPRGAGAFYTPEERTALLIAGLRAGGVTQAAFFLNPGRIGASDGAEARIAAYTAAGHVIADHSFSHRDLQRMPAAAFLADVDKAELWLRGRPGYRPWFRFPGLNQGGRDRAKRQDALAGLAARGLMVAPVTIDGSDWNLDGLTSKAVKSGVAVDEAALRDLYVETMVQSADFSDTLMQRLIGRSPAQVILLHETDLAARYIRPLLAGLKRNGWTIVTADTAFADPIYRLNPDVPAANGTLPEAIALEQKAPGPWYYNRNDLPLARRLFAERVLHRAEPVLPPRPVVAKWKPNLSCPVKLHPWRRVCPPTLSATRTTSFGIAA